MKLLHFADAHIDMASYGRQDPASGLPLRVLDFLRALDTIIDTAIQEKVDLVLFAGDAYKDRSPSPTYQREWGSRIMRLSRARIPTLLLVGNHDLSPAVGRAHAIQEFETLQVPYVQVLAKPQFLGPEQLWGLPLQVLALPWVTRSAFIARRQLQGNTLEEVYSQLLPTPCHCEAAIAAEAIPSRVSSGSRITHAMEHSRAGNARRNA
jgi:exonuclease SbcD